MILVRGGDINHPMSYPEAINKVIPNLSVRTIDIRQDSRAELKENYLFMQLDYKPDVIITNPPFIIAREIIEKSLHDVKDGGLVIMLLRLNFFGSKARFSFWQKNMPSYCYVHSERMGFTDDGKTDSIEYIHSVWIKGQNPRYVKLKII